MKKQFSITLDSESRTRSQAQVVDSSGYPLDAQSLWDLVRQLEFLANATHDEESGAKLKVGHFYWYRRKGGVGYVQFLGMENGYAKVMQVDKTGNPVNTGLGIHEFGWPISSLVPVKDQPSVSVPVEAV